MASAPATTGSRWLYGPLPDLAIGCGLWYAVAFVALSLQGPALLALGAKAWVPFLSLLVSTPHYGATLVRAYSRPEDRRAYTLFTHYATALLVGLLAWGANDAVVGSWILTVYITWSPWHYTGQNYGIAVMFLRRRGVALDDGLKRWLYASFLLSYALTAVALHGGASFSSVAPVSYDASSIRFRSLGFDPAWAGPLVSLLAIGYLSATARAVVGLARRSSLRDLAPALALVGTQALWFSVPLLVRQWGFSSGLHPWESSEGAYYFLWIATGHAAQYLWVSSFYARGQAGQRPPRYWLRTLTAGAAIWTLPSLLFAPGLGGRFPFDAGLGILVASVVNLHHFLLDGAIWKLRDGRVANILIRRTDAQATPAPITPSGWPTRAIAWSVGALCVALLFGAKYAKDVELRNALASGRTDRATRVLERLDRVGRDSAQARYAVGRLAARNGDRDAALAHYERAIALHPQAGTWQRVAGLHQQGGRPEEAIDAYREALALAPDSAVLHYELGRLLLDAERHTEARDAFARAVELAPERGIHRTMLERATLALGTEP